MEGADDDDDDDDDEETDPPPLTVGLFHSKATGTLWLKKSEESAAGKSGSSKRTPFRRHSCRSCSKDFPSHCVSTALVEPEAPPDREDWRGIFFFFSVWTSGEEM